MNDSEAVSEHDKELLDGIDHLLENPENSRLESASLLGFCANLAATQPEASQSFREKLWAGMAAHQGSSGRSPAWSQIQPQQHRRLLFPVPLARRSVLAILAIALTIIIITAAFIPPVRAFADELYNRITLGKYSEVGQVEPVTPGATLSISTPLNIWVIKTGVFNIGGNLPAGADPTVPTFASIEEAQSHVSYPIPQPKYLPDGYRLHEIKVPPENSGALECVVQYYSSPGKDIIVASCPTGEGPVVTNSSKSISLTEQQVTVSQHVVQIQIATDGSLEEAKVDDHIAAWIDGDSLAWQDGATFYQVGGLDLTEVEAIKIAESIR